ncbi:MAG: B12-binding domain-containing protein [Microthrixaceae bacterium]
MGDPEQLAGATDVMGLRSAAELLGVHYMTAYRWVRTSRLPARKRGGCWEVRLDDLQALLDAGDSAPTPGSPSKAGGCGHRVDHLVTSLMRGDAGGAWQLAEECCRAGIAPLDVVCDLVEPALVEVGRRWSTGEITVVDEHRATAVASRMIARLGAESGRRGRTRGTVLTASVEGNRHGLGPAVLADIFRSEGYDAIDLGADLPTAELAEAAATSDALAGVLVSVAGDGFEDAARRTVLALRAVTEAPVLLGGAAVPNRRWAEVAGADGWAADGRRAPEALRRVSGLVGASVH